jgi:hypothetical protein
MDIFRSQIFSKVRNVNKNIKKQTECLILKHNWLTLPSIILPRYARYRFQHNHQPAIESEINTCRVFLYDISILEEDRIAARSKATRVMYDVTEGIRWFWGRQMIWFPQVLNQVCDGFHGNDRYPFVEGVFLCARIDYPNKYDFKIWCFNRDAIKWPSLILTASTPQRKFCRSKLKNRSILNFLTYTIAPLFPIHPILD